MRLNVFALSTLIAEICVCFADVPSAKQSSLWPKHEPQKTPKVLTKADELKHHLQTKTDPSSPFHKTTANYTAGYMLGIASLCKLPSTNTASLMANAGHINLRGLPSGALRCQGMIKRLSFPKHSNMEVSQPHRNPLMFLQNGGTGSNGGDYSASMWNIRISADPCGFETKLRSLVRIDGE